MTTVAPKSSSENVRVAVRCRPLNSNERANNDDPIVKINSQSGSVQIIDLQNSTSAPRQFTFDFAYDANATQKMIYEETAKPIIDGVINGYNGTIFCYGQTGTGLQTIHNNA